MRVIIIKFLVRLFIYSLGITGLGYAFSFLYPSYFNLISFLFLQAFVLLVTVFVHISLIKYSYAVGRPGQFVTRYAAVTALKLFAYVGGLVGYIVVSKYLLHEQKSYADVVVIFLILYVLYTVFETLSIIKFIRRKESDNDW